MVYDIHLDTFEGPLDILLHLIKKNDLEINEIKIAEITAEYLTYLDLMQELNIDIAGEFLVMSSTLIQIKARTLIPSNNEKDILEDDSLSFLKNRLFEYQKYKELGRLLSYKIIENSQIYYRPALPINKQDFVLDATIFDLVGSFRTALTRLPENIKEIMYQEIPIETKIREILDVLEGRQYISFNDILRMQETKTALIVCFMAVLELVKNKQIVAKQSELFSEIRIYRIYNKEE
ncbi:segregation and condensation protein A [Endomicrobiia bacterium]|uniref:Segregation and condensation protein A n=1 Tax=Endomicrobium trichonymphae TaxID=1408204 RepID=B1GZV1_ENDTX|nr:segregation/condensation protein A [Candidatus Endomicrobium trichonymphae]GHT06003.1 segregation and condensation protein A [Endomicrobiia bacterium]BAG13783.1 segregation and condensation protein subunit A [Candidatus Endomicrobium trichonymphae]BAV58854.1 segregation and condensation protein subunit A [Candidatus Endomicrobium trichonymphae]GHT11900.1 segregation and condensation protein A [Endomicrobiia bacterium]GHT15559.1 segregation and condensation protein A [Endomicrobiia bacterium